MSCSSNVVFDRQPVARQQQMLHDVAETTSTTKWHSSNMRQRFLHHVWAMAAKQMPVCVAQQSINTYIDCVVQIASQ